MSTDAAAKAFGNAWGRDMAKLDSAKEEIGWLKVLFAVLAAVDASLVAWLSQTYSTANRILLICAILAAAVITACVVWINRVAYRRIRELGNL